MKLEGLTITFENNFELDMFKEKITKGELASLTLLEILNFMTRNKSITEEQLWPLLKSGSDKFKQDLDANSVRGEKDGS